MRKILSTQDWRTFMFIYMLNGKHINEILIYTNSAHSMTLPTYHISGVHCVIDWFLALLPLDWNSRMPGIVSATTWSFVSWILAYLYIIRHQWLWRTIRWNFRFVVCLHSCIYAVPETNIRGYLVHQFLCLLNTRIIILCSCEFIIKKLYWVFPACYICSILYSKF